MAERKHEGYLHPDYINSLSFAAEPIVLPESGAGFLRRSIPGTDLTDLLGSYSFVVCRDWSALPDEMSGAFAEDVSAALVTDPLDGIPEKQFENFFDTFYLYKQHHVADLTGEPGEWVSRSHRKKARRALKRVTVEMAEEPAAFVEEWYSLYQALVERHGITGLQAFSRDSFRLQLGVPGTLYFRVIAEGEPVGGNIIYLMGDRAYGHLSAFTPEGYALGAPYAVKWEAIHYLRDKASVLWLGAAPGAADSQSGLNDFKAGWATETRPAYLCGKVLNPETYAALSRGYAGDFFPAYRGNRKHDAS